MSPKTDFELVWANPDDIPSEVDTFNEDNAKQQKAEKAKKEEERQHPDLLMENKPSQLGAFN